MDKEAWALRLSGEFEKDYDECLRALTALMDEGMSASQAYESCYKTWAKEAMYG